MRRWSLGEGTAAVAIALLAAGGCGKEKPAPQQVPAQSSTDRASDVAPTNDASFQLLNADQPTRLATLQAVVVKPGNRCASVARGILLGGLDGTDEWRVDCTDSGSWQVWFNNDGGTDVDRCSDAKCS